MVTIGGYYIMSRSKRRTPIVKDHNSGKWGKKQANKKVRREKDFDGKGSSYKKIYNSWDIHDYISYYSKEEAINDWEREEIDPEYTRWRHQRYKTLDRWLTAWEKMIINK